MSLYNRTVDKLVRFDGVSNNNNLLKLVDSITIGRLIDAKKMFRF